MGTAFSAEVSDTRELASVFMDAFGREYDKLYIWFMVQHLRQVMQREAESSGAKAAVWRLYHAPSVPRQINDRDFVMAAKLSKHLKRWKPRFFVLRGDFLLNYYESRADYTEKKHPLGTINLGSVVVNRDATEAEEARLDRLAAACSVPRTDVPSPAKYPPMTVELYHRRHSPVHLQFPVKDRYDIWCTIFERAHWLTARVLTSDCVHERAFVEAIRRARVMCGLSDSLEFSGVETAVLEDAITELLDASVVDKLLLSLSGSSWKDRMSQLRLFHEKSGGLLKNFVWGKWHAIQGRTCSRRVLIEAKVRDGMDDINAFEMPLRQEVHKYTNNETQAFLAAQVEKPLKELAAAVVPQLRDVCATVPRLYEACVLQGKVHYEPRDDHMYLASQYNSIGECYEAERELWRLQEPIAAAKAHFKGRVFEWLVVQNTAVHLLRRVVVNGVFTFETVFERNKLQRPWDDALREVRSLVEADSRTMTPRILAALLYETAVHFFRDEYVQPSLTRLKASMIMPLEGRVTEELRPLVPSVQEIVADVMLDDMRELCRSIADCAVAAA